MEELDALMAKYPSSPDTSTNTVSVAMCAAKSNKNDKQRLHGSSGDNHMHETGQRTVTVVARIDDSKRPWRLAVKK
ncbi:unnamed protein product [Parnassius apollo]|uniref:(apollo) hypothetical protein n=1 Tax=Parnassius apollo TaxID=110799 RepID=A0A8S3X0T4_PARAO|nr:unnamed protein product [Parnassius apollo]